MSIFQIIAVLFALVMVYVTTIHGRRAHLSKIEMLAWQIMWVGFMIVALFPNLLLGLAGVLRFARVFDLLVVIASMILAAVVFVSYFTQRQSARRIEDFIRSQALSTGARSKDTHSSSARTSSPHKRSTTPT